MTIKERYDKEEKWQNRAILIDTYHSRMILLHGKEWKLRDTAKYFCKSLAKISEDMMIAKALHKGLEAKNRDMALKLIKLNGLLYK